MPKFPAVSTMAMAHRTPWVGPENRANEPSPVFFTKVPS